MLSMTDRGEPGCFWAERFFQPGLSVGMDRTSSNVSIRA